MKRKFTYKITQIDEELDKLIKILMNTKDKKEVYTQIKLIKKLIHEEEERQEIFCKIIKNMVDN